MRPTSPMWLTHHYPEHYERCVAVGSAHLCRRCVVLYPAMLAVAVAPVSGWIPSGVGRAIMWLAPLGVVAEWFAEHLFSVAYSARRQVATTAVASLAFGVALGRHLVHPFELAATLPAVAFTMLCLAAWFIGVRRRSGAAQDWEADFERAEAERIDALRVLLDRPASSA